METQTISGDNRLARIERGLDRELANNMPVSRSTGGTMTIAPQSMGELMEFSKLMSLSSFCIRPSFRGNPGACLAVSLLAFRCGGDPWAFANKAYIVKNQKGEETISYESQLIHAIVTTSKVLQRRLRAEYSGEGPQRRCKITGWLKGEDQPFEYLTPTVAEIKVRNSPLWEADRDQQLFYYATRAWARRHVPEILLGIYAPEEMGDVIDMESEPEPQPGDFQAEPEPEPERFEVVALDSERHEFGTPEAAIDALRTVLNAARRGGRKMLEAAAENNERLLESLGEAGAALLAEFAPEETQTRETPPPPPAAPDPEKPPPAPPEATADEMLRDPAEGRRIVPPEEPPLSGEVDQAPDESERVSRAIQLPVTRGKPDYSMFVRALLIPKVKQQTSSNDLAYLLGDNAEAIEAARGLLAARDVAELDEAIEAAWSRLR